MKKMKQPFGRLFLLTTLATFATAIDASAAVIYADTFSGTPGSTLNGLAPTTRPGSETWAFNSGTSFATGFQADGTVAAGGGDPGGRVAALLPFTPVSGNIYSLSARVNANTASGQWVGLGFADALIGASGLFAFGNINGISWMLKGDAGSAALQGFAGPQNTNIIVNTFAGSTVDLRIVLDTTAALWTTSMFNGLVQLGSTFTYSANPTIAGVGFSKVESFGGSVDDFKLEVIPEPSSVALGLLGLSFLLSRRRP